MTKSTRTRPATDRGASPAPPTVPPALAGRTAAAVIRGLDTLTAARDLVWEMDQLEATATVLSSDAAADVDAAHRAMWEASGTADLRDLVAAIATVATDPTGLGGAVPDHEQEKELRARFEPVAAAYLEQRVDRCKGQQTKDDGAALLADPAGTDPLFELKRKHGELRAELEQFRRELAGEVRTRRLIVEDAETQTVVEGHHLMVRNRVSGSHVDLTAGTDGAEVHAYSGPDGGLAGEHLDSTTVSVFAGCGFTEDDRHEDGEARITFYTADEERRMLSGRPHPGPADPHPTERSPHTSSAADDTYGALMDLVASRCGAEFMLSLEELVGIRLAEAKDDSGTLLVDTREELGRTKAELKDAHMALRTVTVVAQTGVNSICATWVQS